MTLQQGMTNKEKRMLKAARKRWQENKDLKTIASELNVAYQTVKNYFSGDKMERFERFYSESDKQLLDAQLEQMIQDGTSTALDIKGDLQSDPSVDGRTRIKLMKEAQKIPERHITMLQELGIVQKPKERKEIQDSTGQGDDLMKRMQEAQKQLSEANSSENQEKKDKEKVEN